MKERMPEPLLHSGVLFQGRCASATRWAENASMGGRSRREHPPIREFSARGDVLSTRGGCGRQRAGDARPRRCAMSDDVRL